MLMGTTDAADVAPSRAAQRALAAAACICVRQAVCRGARLARGACCDARWTRNNPSRLWRGGRGRPWPRTKESATPDSLRASFLFWDALSSAVPGSDGLCTGTPSTLIPSSISPSLTHPALVLGLSLSFCRSLSTPNLGCLYYNDVLTMTTPTLTTRTMPLIQSSVCAPCAQPTRLLRSRCAQRTGPADASRCSTSGP